jgi:hypothetical protein
MSHQQSDQHGAAVDEALTDPRRGPGTGNRHQAGAEDDAAFEDAMRPDPPTDPDRQPAQDGPAEADPRDAEPIPVDQATPAVRPSATGTVTASPDADGQVDER